MSPHSRRSVLRTTGGITGTVAVASIAGCSSIPFLGSGPGYSKWLYEPGTVFDEDHYEFTYMDTDTFENNEDEFDSDTYEALESVGESVGRIDLDFDDLRSNLSFQRTTVITGDYDVGDVEGELEDADYDDDEEVGGYTVWVNEDRASAYGVSGGDIVIGQAGFGRDVEALEIVETTIETKRGNEDRYTDKNDDFKTLVNKLGGGDIVSGSTQEETGETNEERGRFEGEVASGARYKVNGSTTNIKRVRVFDDASDVDMGNIEDWIDEQEGSDGSTVEEANSVNANKSGRAAVVKIDIDTDEL